MMEKKKKKIWPHLHEYVNGDVCIQCGARRGEKVEFLKLPKIKMMDPLDAEVKRMEREHERAMRRLKVGDEHWL